jgi:hypothetical protein
LIFKIVFLGQDIVVSLINIFFEIVPVWDLVRWVFAYLILYSEVSSVKLIFLIVVDFAETGTNLIFFCFNLWLVIKYLFWF